MIKNNFAITIDTLNIGECLTDFQRNKCTLISHIDTLAKCILLIISEDISKMYRCYSSLTMAERAENVKNIYVFFLCVVSI